MRTLPLLFSTLGLVALATGQNLRKGLVDADCVIVGRQVGKKPHGDSLSLHRVQVLENLRGADGYRAVTVIDCSSILIILFSRFVSTITPP